MQSNEKIVNPSSFTVSGIVSFVLNSLDNKECNKLTESSLRHLSHIYGLYCWLMLVIANAAFVMDRQFPQYSNLFFFIVVNFHMSLVYTNTRDGQIIAWNSALGIFGLGFTYLLKYIALVEPILVGYVLICIASMFLCFRISLNVGQTGWFYFTATLLTLFTSGYVLPFVMNYFFGNFIIDVQIRRLYLQLGMIVVCSFIIHQTSVMIENGCAVEDDGFEQFRVLIANFHRILKPFVEPLRWGVILLRESISFSRYLFIKVIKLFMAIYEPCLYCFRKLKPYVKSLFTSIIRELVILYEPTRYVILVFKNFLYRPIIEPLVRNIFWCFKQLFNVNLLHLGVIVVYVYAFYKIYGYFR